VKMKLIKIHENKYQVWFAKCYKKSALETVRREIALRFFELRLKLGVL